MFDECRSRASLLPSTELGERCIKLSVNEIPRSIIGECVEFTKEKMCVRANLATDLEKYKVNWTYSDPNVSIPKCKETYLTT